MTAAKRDGVTIFGIAATLLVVFVEVEAFEFVVGYSRKKEHYEFDEFLAVLMVMPIAAAVFGWRRILEVRKELALRIDAENSAIRMALHDPLTGLANRRHAEQQIAAALASATPDARVAILLIDLDRFKLVNDLHGNAAGDRLLVQIGQRLRELAGSEALVARLGGDKFTVLYPKPLPGVPLIQQVVRISEGLDKPYSLVDGELVVDASIGVTVVDQPGMTSDHVLAQADAAMYRCKDGARNGFAFFETGMESAAVRRAQIEAELRQAIAQGQIEPFYQPLVTLSDGGIMGYEALARWRMADGSIRYPDEFIPIAEDCGLIGEIYYSVLQQAVNSARNWKGDLSFSINLSPVQFEDERLVDRTIETLEKAGVCPTRLEIEMTESAFVSNIERAQEVITQFKSHGIRVALDDFGTGYSSLRHLSEFRPDKIKIDRSFILDLATNPASQMIVRTVTALAHSLGLHVTVEGVETADNEADVRRYGCDHGQGYLYGRPQACPASKLLSQDQAANHDSFDGNSEDKRAA